MNPMRIASALFAISALENFLLFAVYIDMGIYWKASISFSLAVALFLAAAIAWRDKP